jgi:hypothetical protein|tara:strand:- start:579 stop:2381 length:1803 start_codon:yes stop_codon:yes gene_type:complete
MAQKAELKAKINLDSSGFSKGIEKAKSKVKNFASSATASFVRVGAAFAGINLVKGIANLGLAAGETASKFKAVFGPATDEMNEKVQELRKTIPSTTAEMQNSLATFAAMAKAFGMNSEAAGMFSVEMVKIAGDIASFHNLPIEDAFTKIRSAISGEFEPMKQLGIVINEATIKQEALNLAIYEGTGQLGPAQKALAVQSIMIRNLGEANGDAAATADSAANRVKFLRAELLETGTKIGTTALPAILALTQGLALMLSKTKEFTDFAGTKVGEMVYGPTDETLEKQKEAISLFDAQKQATKELTEQGKLYKQGMFEGTLWTDGLSEKLEENKRLIKERTDEILQGNAAQKESSEDLIEAKEEEIKTSEDLAATLTDQIETEVDPKRKKALKDRLQAYQDLLNAAGELKTIENLTPKQIQAEKDKVALAEKQLALIKAQAAEDDALTHKAQQQLDLEKSIQSIMKSANVDRAQAVKLAKDLAKASAGADTNQSGYTTPREQRAAERKQRKEDQARRKRERKERAGEVGADQRARDKAREARMREREKANGIDTGKGGSGSDSKKPSGEKAKDQKDSKAMEQSAKDTADNTKEILTEIQKNPS